MTTVEKGQITEVMVMDRNVFVDLKKDVETSNKLFLFMLITLKQGYIIKMGEIYLKAVTIFILIFLCFTKYEQLMALELAFYSRITYKITNVKKWQCLGCDLSPLIDREDFKSQKYDLYGYTGYSPKIKAIVVAIRGTTLSLHNLKTDIDYYDIQYKKTSNGKVHRSFYLALERIRDPLIQKVNTVTQKYPGAKIYVTGHSLGGALAVLAAAEISDSQDVTAVYTFGEPRVGNKKFAEYIDSILDVYRVINRNDPVPSMPPRTSPLQTVAKGAKSLGGKVVQGGKKVGSAVKKGATSLFSKTKSFFHFKAVPTHDSFINFSYQHEGYQIWYVPEDKAVYECDAEEKDCHDSIPIYKKRVTDHLISNYMKTIETAISEKWIFS